MASFVSVIQLPATPETAWSFVVDHGHTIEPLRIEPQSEQGAGTAPVVCKLMERNRKIFQRRLQAALADSTSG